MHAVVVLLDDAYTATTLAGVISDLCQGSTTVALVPPVRGIAFFADASASAHIDRWWGDNVPSGALPLYVMDFAPEVLPWLEGVDGTFVMRGAPRGIDSAPGTPVVPVRADTLLDLASRVVDTLGGGQASNRTQGGTFSGADMPGTADLRDGRASDASPFDLLAAATAMPEDAAAPPVSERSVEFPGDVTSPATGRPHQRRSLTSVLRLPAWRGARAGGAERHASDIELAGALAQRGSTIVAVGSRKGGVGKTSHAAGMAILSGSLLDAIGHRAVIVDANVANPDAWGVLNLPSGAATVRETIAALAANLDPPRPVHATTPALACYPEARETSEYSRHDIDLLAAHLRRAYAVAVVDLTNRLPDATGGPEAAAAAYWLEHADVVVLPTAWSKQDFNGVLDYLELPALPPAVVAYITPRSRRHREHPLTQRYLDAIAQRATRIVELPDEADNVRYAGMAGVPIDSVSRRLRDGYRALTEAVVDVAGPSRV